ncbi:hypothetical protein Ahy_A04g020671 [Arachis hypogaea]|uniref:Ribonuclease H1 N-terminal domain-containing protein n=1 Tax=Arachis hypogaea TaxID=3818 RepID=A0A445DIB2_ARAHY|nr:hypothetical protein Ahy_A04g020671 [Arachis hypogaea]
MKSTQQAKPSEFSQLSVVDKSGEEKIPENKTIAEIIKKSTQDKKYYVIYNGPMKGVYDAWEKAAPFTHQSRIIHKGGFLTLEEAKESFREYEALHPEQTLKRVDKAPIQTQRTGIIRNIPTRAEIKEKKRVCRSNLRETLNIVLNWTEEKRAILGYYPIAKEQLTKPVIFPEASPSDTYQFFHEFPAGFVDAVKRFKNMIDNVNPRDISLKFTNSQPIFNEEKEECLVPAHQDLTIYSHEGRLASTLARVFEITQKITKESRTRINYKSRNTLLVSSKKNEIEEREMRLLVEFESAFYNLSGVLEKLPEGIKRNLCYLIKDREDHKCQLCVSELSEESNNETESTHMIKEEDNASEGHMIKEEDSTSEASLNIIA